MTRVDLISSIKAQMHEFADSSGADLDPEAMAGLLSSVDVAREQFCSEYVRGLERTLLSGAIPRRK